MLPALMAAGKIAAVGLPMLLGSRRSGKPFDPSGIINKYLGMNAQGYNTPDDFAAAERGMNRAGASAGARFNAARMSATNRMASRGLLYSPAAEYVQGDINRQAGDAALSIAGQGQDQLYKTRMGREAFDQQKIMAAMGAELGAAQQNYAGDQARQSSFWNSMLPFASNAASWFGGGLKGGGGGGGWSDANTADSWSGVN